MFHGNQVAVTANVQPEGADLEARLILVDVESRCPHRSSQQRPDHLRRLGGATEALAVNSNGSVIYMTGSSVSRDGHLTAKHFARSGMAAQNPIQNVGLGSIPGNLSVEPVFESVGYAVNSSGVVGGSSDRNHAVFEYDQADGVRRPL